MESGTWRSHASRKDNTMKPSDELTNLHRGLHFAMEALINKKDYSEAERLLRQVDAIMANCINKLERAGM
jgi:hypothetical protein